MPAHPPEWKLRIPTMKNNLDNLINPNTEQTVTASTGLTWLWVLLVGPLHHLFLGRVSTTGMYLLLTILTLGLAPIYYLFWCRTVARSYYLSRGFIPMSVHKKVQQEREDHKQLLQTMAMK